jgi:pimeloyl-ACP methyl ester carboxylesterase
MQITSETATDGVMERLFDLDVAGERVPGVLWSPPNATGSRPLLLLGHGGSLHKKFPRLVAQAHSYVTKLGFAVVAIDAPSHGERVRSERSTQFAALIKQRIAEGQSFGEELSREMSATALQSVPEWRATLDAIQTLDFVGANQPIGYMGLSMGSAIGMPFVAAEPRIVAAIFGLAGLHPGNDALAQVAAQITIPIEFVLQWGDELVSRDSGLALFDAFGSREKTLHANLGGHAGTPAFEAESWQRFFARHLVKGAVAS